MDQRPVVSNLDFQSLKDDMVNFFKERPEFEVYEFSGSSLNLLMDILAYNTHYNALTANFQLNESFLDTSLIRSNVVSLAKTLNYIPRSARSAFTTFNFYTIEDFTVNFADGQTNNQIDIQVFEGQILTQRFVHTSNNSEFPTFDLEVTNIDTTTLTVSLDGQKLVQITPETEGSTSLDKNSKIFFIEETRAGSHRLLLGNNNIGIKPNIGSVIYATFIKSSGEIANGAKNFTVNVPGRNDISIVGTVSPAQGGQAPESIQSIKDTAPHWFQSQFRAVTVNDYKAFLVNKFADIQSINVYGGEDVNQPGKVFIAIKPKSGDKLTNATKDTLLSEILDKSSVVTVRPEFVDPEIIKLVLKTVVIFDQSNLVTNRNAVKAKVLSLIRNLNTAYVGSFLSDFNESFFSSQISDLDTSIVSSNTRVSLRIDLTASGGKVDKYNLKFVNKLYHPNDGFNASKGGVVTSNLFLRTGKTDQSGFDDDGFGNLRLFDFIDGKKVTVDPTAGSINYNTGEIELQDFSPQDGEIRFTAIPDSFDVIATENTILQTAPDESSVDVIEKSEKAIIKNLNLSRSI